MIKLLLLLVLIVLKSHPAGTVLPATAPTPTSTFAPTPSVPTHTPRPAADSSWQYPGSVVVGTMKWESRDDAKKITEWYKSKLVARGANAKSFVQTETNGEVLNKLVAAGSNGKIAVEISKKMDNPVVTISVVLDN